jgi:L-alanine-DL-glutamate epimerase-like enolase superfamily enzyme
MKITDVVAIPVTFPFEREPLSFCFVRVQTDDGLVGYGECCDSYGCTFAGVVAAAVTDAFAPLLVGEELVAVAPVVERLRAWTRRRLGDRWVGAQARSGVELALWDIVGQAAGHPVSALLGRVRDRVAVYASSVFLEEGDAHWHAELLRPLLDRGVTMVKLRVGPNWRHDLTTLAELQRLLGPDVEVMVDGSEIFTVPTALAVAHRLADLGVTWFEEPLLQGARAGIGELGRSSPVSLAYGEHLFGVAEAVDLVEHGHIGVLQPDAATCGGIDEARAMAAVGIAAGLRVVPHVAAGPVALAANLHVAASVPAIRAVEYPYPLSEAWAALGTGSPLGPDTLVDGTLPVPDRPGLGVRLDEGAASHYAYQRIKPRPGFPDRFMGDR